jgi:hypothetical protein
MAKSLSRGTPPGENLPPLAQESRDTATAEDPDEEWNSLQVPRGPRSGKEQRKAFRYLGIAPRIYERLWNNEDECRQARRIQAPETIVDLAAQREKVLRWLMRVKLNWAVNKGLAKRNKFVYGEARGSVRQRNKGGKPEKPGVLQRADAAVEDLRAAIERFLVVAAEIALPTPEEGQPAPPEEAQPHGLAFHDRRISCARPLVEELRDVLTNKTVTVDPRLRGRVRGNPGMPKLFLRAGEASRSFKWTGLKRRLAVEVRSLVSTREEASRLASDLLQAVYPKAKRRQGR